MTIVCSKCGKQFISVIVDRSLALKEVEGKSILHMRERHREIFEALAKGIQITGINLARLLHFDECVVVPEDEEFITEQLGECEEIVMMAIGYDPDTEEEDEEDGDGLEEEEGEVVEMPLTEPIELTEQEDKTDKEIES